VATAAVDLKVGDEASARVTLYGQEKDATTSGLARQEKIDAWFEAKTRVNDS